MYEGYKYLKFDRRGLILTVTMDNLPVNAIGFGLHGDLARVFTEIEQDETCNVVVLTGAGKYFSGGGDLPQMLANLDDPGKMATEMTQAPRITHSLLALSKPIIARVNGHAMGLGATLALLCDIVFITDTAKIGDPHVNVGLSAGDGGALIWPHLVGFPRARHHLLTGEPMTGAEAKEAGMVHAAVSIEALDEAVYSYAQKLAEKPFQALSATKRSLNMTLCRQALADATSQVGLETLCMIAPDHREALLAISEKRAPNFTHGR